MKPYQEFERGPTTHKHPGCDSCNLEVPGGLTCPLPDELCEISKKARVRWCGVCQSSVFWDRLCDFLYGAERKATKEMLPKWGISCAGCSRYGIKGEDCPYDDCGYTLQVKVTKCVKCGDGVESHFSLTTCISCAKEFACKCNKCAQYMQKIFAPGYPYHQGALRAAAKLVTEGSVPKMVKAKKNNKKFATLPKVSFAHQVQQQAPPQVSWDLFTPAPFAPGPPLVGTTTTIHFQTPPIEGSDDPGFLDPPTFDDFEDEDEY